MGVPYAPRYANGHISAMRYPIQFMFGSRVGFSGSADRMALFPVTSNPSWRQAAILDNSEWPSPHLCDSTAFLSSYLFTVQYVYAAARHVTRIEVREV